MPFLPSPRARTASRVGFACAILGGLLLFSGCREDQTIRVDSLKINGVHHINAGQLRAALATQASSWLPWGATHYFSRPRFEADLKRIVAFYRDRGFPDAKVTSFDVKLNDKQDAADITIDVDEGQPLTVERIDFEGFDVLPTSSLASLEGRLPLKEGQPLDRALAQASREAALDEVKDHGYPYASVSLTDHQGSNDHARIVTVHATPGTLAHYGPIDIVGNSSVSDAVVERQLTYRPGEPYRLSQIEDSQRKLYALGTFQFANIRPNAPEGQEPAILPTRVTVREGKARKVDFGIGYGSEEKARGTIDWRHVNFFGGARTMEFKAQYSSLDRGVRADFRQPSFPFPRYGLTASAQTWHNDEPSYTLDTNGGSLTIERPLAKAGPNSQRNATTTLLFTYTHEWERYQISNDALNDLSFRDELIALRLNPTGQGADGSAEGQGLAPGEGRGLLSSLEFDVRRSNVENEVSARTGYVINAHVEHAGKFLQGDFDYFETTAEGRYYFALGRRSVLAVRAHIGAINGYGPENLTVPFFKRYFLGGANSLRGWGRFEVSPLSGSGLPIGGHTEFESSVELRLPIWGNLSGVAFADMGNVWTDPWHFGSLRYDAGPGLRYNTPIGPFRLDVGYQLNPYANLLVNGEPEQRHFRIHFSIGQAF